jgi:hypothetical protein
VTAKHTPGPWLVAMTEEIDGELMPDGSGGCSHTGVMVYDRRLGVCTKEDLEQGEYEPEPLARPWNEADARLIAAAPELLEALKNIRSMCLPGMNWTDDIGLALLAEADAAIAKAEGRE